MRYVALLRGVNVVGNTMINMTELNAAIERLGFKNVVSYINSGNIAFDYNSVSSPNVSTGLAFEQKLVNQIEKAIEKKFGKYIPVMIREQKDIPRILAKNPFDGEFESHKEMHVLFLKDKMPKDKQKMLMEKQIEDERFAVRGREIYCHLKLGVAGSLLGKGFIERKLKTTFTARNLRTVQRLAQM